MLDRDTERFVKKLDWNLLRTFALIVEEGSITAAANRLMLRQPTISLALQRLEAQIGTRLIDRGRGSFRVTAAGRELYRECVDIFRSVARLPEVADLALREVTGQVRIALASHVVTPLLDDILTEFHHKYPSVTYRIGIETSANVARAVLDHRASFGICLVRKRIPKLEYTLLYREFFGFFCGPPHALFGRTDLTMKSLQGHSAVSFDTDEPDDALRPVALLRQRFGLEQTIIGHSSHLEEVRRMVLCGLGIGPLPIHVATRDVADGLLWRLPLYESPPAIDIYFVRDPNARQNRAEKLFGDEILNAVQALDINQRTYRT